jgi:hypothetical protein
MASRKESQPSTRSKAQDPTSHLDAARSLRDTVEDGSNDRTVPGIHKAQNGMG